MPRPVSPIDCIFQHLTVLAETPEHYRPRQCVHCGCGGLWNHGCYGRKPRCGEHASSHWNPIPIPRFFCRWCRRTCSTLPCVLSPRRWYAWAVQQWALMVVLAGGGDERAAEAAGVHASTARRWRRWLQRRHPQLAFAVRQHWPQLGYAAHWRALWRRCCTHWGLGEAMRRAMLSGLSVP